MTQDRDELLRLLELAELEPVIAQLHHEKQDGGRFIVYLTAGNDIVPVAAIPSGVEGYGRERGRARAQLFAAAANTVGPLLAQQQAYELRIAALEAGIMRLGSMEAFVMSRAIDPRQDAELLARIDHARTLLTPDAPRG